MSEAPERIWVDPSNGSSDGKWFLASEWPRLGKQDVEYFRGDLYEELEKRIEELEAERDHSQALAEMLRDKYESHRVFSWEIPERKPRFGTVTEKIIQDGRQDRS